MNDIKSRKNKDITKKKYERWLMIVDETGEVVNITVLDKSAKTIGSIEL